MTGQDAVTVAENFNETLALDGVILTKLDGDARGGAALSVKEVVGKPIAFASTGEKLDDFDLFHPDRLAGRILGMGDVLTLIEKAEEVFEEKEAEAAAQKLMEGQFTFDDFLDQMQQVKKMGSISCAARDDARRAQGGARTSRSTTGSWRRIEGMIHSMTTRGAGRPVDHRRLPPGPHRRRLGHRRRPDLPAGQAVQGDAEDDEVHAGPGQPHDQAQEEEEEQEEGRPRHAQGRPRATAPKGKQPFTLPGLDN